MAPPKRLPFILAIALPLVFSLGLAPLLSSVSNPNDNIQRLEIWVNSLDSSSSSVGTAFLNAVNGVINGPALPVPRLVIKSSLTADELKEAVVHGDAWGCIYVNNGAATNLVNALTTAGGGTVPSSYTASSAMTFYWDEARNNIVSQRVAGFARTFMNTFSATYAKIALTNVNSNAIGTIISTKPDLLTVPISYTEINLAPFDVPIVTTAQLIGNILMMVFGMVIANVVLGPIMFFTNPHKMNVRQRLIARIVAVIVYSMTVSAAFATMVIGLANTYKTGNEYFYTGNGPTWASLWSLLWLQLSLFAFFFLSVGLFFNSPAPIGLFLLPVLLWNVLGGFNTDLANTGYQFFWYTPVYHAAFVMKAILFNTQPHLVSRSIGILFLWWFIDIGLFLLTTYKNEKIIALHHTKPISAIESMPTGPTASIGKELSTGDTPVVVDTPLGDTAKMEDKKETPTPVNVEIVHP